MFVRLFVFIFVFLIPLFLFHLGKYMSFFLPLIHLSSLTNQMSFFFIPLDVYRIVPWKYRKIYFK